MYTGKLSFIALFVTAMACQKAADQNVVAGRLQSSTPEEESISSDSLAEIRDYMQQYIDSAYIAGGVVLVSRNNKIVYNESFGHFDRKKTQGLKTTDIFRLASMTKPIITVAALQLYEQGKLDLHDPVSKYIPAFKNSNVMFDFHKEDSSYSTRPANREITLHHLLTHTSGIGYGFSDPVAGAVYDSFDIVEAWSKDSVTLSMNIPRIGRLPLLHDPGEKFTYGLSLDVIGHVVEIVSGLPLDKYLQKHIFEPLAMNDTYFFLPDEKANRLVEVWYRGDFTRESFPESFRDDYPVSGHKTYFMGGGGLSSTAADYAQFANALLNKGKLNGTQILKAETVDLMMKNQIDTLFLQKDIEQFGYGAALYTADDTRGRKKGRYSWGGFWQTTFWIDPSRELVGVVMTNAFDSPKSSDFFSDIEDIVNKSVKEKN